VATLEVAPRDWWAALAAAPPPCSKRDVAASLAAEGGAPLPRRLAPLLLPTLARALHVLAASGCVPTLTTQLAVAASAVGSGAAQPGDAAISELERLMSEAGAVEQLPDATPCEAGSSAPAGGAAAGPCPRSRVPCHLLLDGAPAAGQEPAARALLALLRRGGAAVHSLALPGLLLRGHGDAVSGLTSVVAQAFGRAGSDQVVVLYAPRIEMWAGGAFEAREPWGEDQEQEEENAGGEEVGGGGCRVAAASPAWAVFEQLLRQAPPNVGVVVVATCHVAASRLPGAALSLFAPPAAAAAPPAARLLQLQLAGPCAAAAVVEAGEVRPGQLSAALARSAADAARLFAQWLSEAGPPPASPGDAGAAFEGASAPVLGASAPAPPCGGPSTAAACGAEDGEEGGRPSGLDATQWDEAQRLFGAFQRGLVALGESIRTDPRARVARAVRASSSAGGGGGGRRRAGRAAAAAGGAVAGGAPRFLCMQALGAAAAAGWFVSLDEFRECLARTVAAIRSALWEAAGSPARCKPNHNR
jgi:hypothetical protein